MPTMQERYLRAAGAGLLLFLQTACGSPVKQGNQIESSPQAAATQTALVAEKLSIGAPDILMGTGSLADYMSKDLIAHFELEGLIGAKTNIYKFTPLDKKPTYLYLYDNSVDINPEAVSSAYDALTSRNFELLARTLTVGRIPSRDYRANTADPRDTIFRYDYSPDSIQQPIGITPYSLYGTTKERHVLIVSNNQALPTWANGPAITRQYFIPNKNPRTDSDIIQTVTSFNVDRLRQMGGDPNNVLNSALITEICQQMIIVQAESGGKLVTPGSALDIIAKEGTCNTLGLVSALKRLGTGWTEVKRQLSSSFIGGIPIAPLLRYFPVTEEFYNLLPDNGLLVQTK